MIGQVIAMEPQDYEAWLAGGSSGPAIPPAQAGEKLFTQFGCISCHTGTPTGRGPTLNGRVRQHGAARRRQHGHGR